MKKYLLVFASGVSLLWLIAGYLPVQAKVTNKVAEENYQLNPTDAASVITEFTTSEKKNDYQQAPKVHEQYLEFQDISDSKKQKKYLVAQQTNSQKEKVESIPTPTFKIESVPTPNSTTSNSNSVPSTDTSIDQVTSVSQLSDVQPTDCNTARLRIFGGDFEDVETRYIASLQGFRFLEFS